MGFYLNRFDVLPNGYVIGLLWYDEILMTPCNFCRYMGSSLKVYKFGWIRFDPNLLVQYANKTVTFKFQSKICKFEFLINSFKRVLLIHHQLFHISSFPVKENFNSHCNVIDHV